MGVEIRPSALEDLGQATGRCRTICRPVSQSGATRSLSFACFAESSDPSAFATVVQDSTEHWDLGLYVFQRCSREALAELLETAIEAARSKGATVIQTAVEMDADRPLQLFGRLGLSPRSLLQQGGESAVEFDISAGAGR